MPGRWVARCCLAVTISLLAAHPSAAASATLENVDFERVALSGDPLRLSEFRGQWVVVNFWATWCGPCVREMPLLQDIHDQRADVTVIGVNFEEIDDAGLKDFVDDLKVTFPIVRAGSQPLLPFEPLKGLPSTFVVSPEGALVARKVGEVDRAWLDARTDPAAEGK